MKKRHSIVNKINATLLLVTAALLIIFTITVILASPATIPLALIATFTVLNAWDLGSILIENGAESLSNALEPTPRW